MQQFDALVIGAGLSGLTAASLMAKRGLSVGVLDRNAHPGGSCGAFKRGDALFDQGAAMLFGFGAHGFNPHRFVFDALEEPIDVIRHESMYALDFAGKRIEFKPDLERFTDDLAGLFPGERAAIKRFYADLETLYRDVVVGTPTFTTPDEMDGKRMMPQIKAHPRSYLQFLGLMNRSVADLLGRYFEDPGIFQFFDKLCSTYCYTTAAETPAVLGAVMFVDNHVGGTYYPAGSTLMLPGKLEKAIEAHGGTMLMRREVEGILFEGGRPCGVRCVGGEEFHAATVVHAGTVWDLVPAGCCRPGKASRREQRWVESLVPTAASAVVYLLVRAEVVPTDALPVEMFALHPDRLADDEVTAYAMSLDDPTLCPPGTHVLTVVGPCLDATDPLDPQGYLQMKRRLVRRFLGVLERRCPGIGQAVLHCEVATPATISRYAGKYRGAVAGPKQMMGQHLMKRQHTRTRWKGLYCCGESTVMGTGTPTVTISGIAAANAVLKECGQGTVRVAARHARLRARSAARPRRHAPPCGHGRARDGARQRGAALLLLRASELQPKRPRPGRARHHAPRGRRQPSRRAAFGAGRNGCVRTGPFPSRARVPACPARGSPCPHSLRRRPSAEPAREAPSASPLTPRRVATRPRWPSALRRPCPAALGSPSPRGPKRHGRPSSGR